MQTRCPKCETLFAVKQELIDTLDARARCGMCRTVFNARDCLLHEPPPIATKIRSTTPTHSSPNTTYPPAKPGADQADTRRRGGITGFEDDPPPWGISPFDDDWDDTLNPKVSGQPAASNDPDPEPDNSALRDEEDPLELLHQTKPRTASGTGWWLLGCVILLLTLGGQWVYNHWAALMAEPQIRPVLQQFCHYTGCQPDPLRNIDAIDVLSHSVYSHPNIDDALIISLAMINNAHYAQPFPTLAIHMANVRGEIIAQRNFTPENYLDASSASGLMSPGSPVTITLEVHDPGNDALTFELAFL